MPNYGDATYWDNRYSQAKNATFDWLEGWKDIKQVIEENAMDGLLKSNDPKAARQSKKILNLGCGNSVVCEDMYDEGYTQIWNMDISAVCIDHMRLRNQTRRPSMLWEVMDVRDLKYPDEFFDMILDKSTIDALLCGTAAFLNVAVMMKEC